MSTLADGVSRGPDGSARDPRSDQVRSIAAAHLGEPGPLLVVLHAVQASLGHLERSDLETVADVLNLSVAEVVGVVSFYKDLRTAPAPAHTVHLCRAEACQAVGADALFAAADEHFAGRDDVEFGEIFCFGNCALGPSGSIDGRLHGRLTAERLETLTKEWTR